MDSINPTLTVVKTVPTVSVSDERQLPAAQLQITQHSSPSLLGIVGGNVDRYTATICQNGVGITQKRWFPWLLGIIHNSFVWLVIPSPGSVEAAVNTEVHHMCLTAMPPEGSTRVRILRGRPSLDRGSREAEVGCEPRTFQSVNSCSNHSGHLAPTCCDYCSISHGCDASFVVLAIPASNAANSCTALTGLPALIDVHCRIKSRFSYVQQANSKLLHPFSLFAWATSKYPNPHGTFGWHGVRHRKGAIAERFSFED
ncbi:hypothetical protein T265_07842 [Opisthorchis viverrini]|uniref:Uncharacterized protein n=1 Tax=Opisthorchis viverrini TaxID=6198 RepID=A0A074ZFQ4_OPIVI|nr:hypothetical protein T265_07842 [Opisthorchis viverrini]KER24472.1 hypothetical protein T265_07842 [Opisthorchis viverrini]